MGAFIASERMGYDEKTERFYPTGVCHAVNEGDDTTFCVLPVSRGQHPLTAWQDRDWATLQTNAVVTRCEACENARQ